MPFEVVKMVVKQQATPGNLVVGSKHLGTKGNEHKKKTKYNSLDIYTVLPVSLHTKSFITTHNAMVYHTQNTQNPETFFIITHNILSYHTVPLGHHKP